MPAFFSCGGTVLQCGLFAWSVLGNDEIRRNILYVQPVIFGREKKLEAAIQEAYDLFKPKGIAVFATCPGDPFASAEATMATLRTVRSLPKSGCRT